MNIDKMHYLDKYCCICINKTDLKHLFELDSDGVSHYNKLTLSVNEMNFKEMNDQRLICAECCITLNTVYNFRQMCLRSKTNLISYISQLQTNLIAESNPQIELPGESYKENISLPASVKEESEDDDNSAHVDATVDHMNEGAHSDIKVEDVENQTMMEDYSECYMEFKIDFKEEPLAEVTEEPKSDTETPQDGSTNQADIGTSKNSKGSEETTVGTELQQKAEKDNEGLHQCEICQKNFNYKNSLVNHKKKHSRDKSLTPFECEICKKRFNLKCYLSIHMKSHSNKRPYECEICKRVFKYKYNVKTHMKSHSSERSYECEICKIRFKHKNNLTSHMLIHSSERPYECEICKKCFNNKWHLAAHMISHSSERLHECEICKMSYKHRSTLSAHMLKHSSERPYECDICKWRFDKMTSCKRHMKRHSD